MKCNTFVGVVLTTLCLALPARAPADLTAVNSRKIASDFTLSDSKGASVKLSDYKGQVVLLDFWATWCGGCKVEIPWYMEFQNKYRASGLSVIGVSMDDDGWKSVKPFLEKQPVNYPIVIGNPELAKRYMVDAMPMTLLSTAKVRSLIRTSAWSTRTPSRARSRYSFRIVPRTPANDYELRDTLTCTVHNISRALARSTERPSC